MAVLLRQTFNRSPRKVAPRVRRCTVASTTELDGLQPEHELFPAVPGLVLFRDFLRSSEKETFETARSFAMQVHARAEQLGPGAKAVESRAHNLPSSERFLRLTLPVDAGAAFDADGAGASSEPSTLSCEHFTTYGEGHRLTYFRGNGNIPILGVGPDFLLRLGRLPWAAEELRKQRASRNLDQEAPRRWRMTLNHYHRSQGTPTSELRPGFPWHRDLEANGAFTAILALGAPAALEFGRPQAPAPDGLRQPSTSSPELLAKIIVQPGSLLLLSGAARWELLHRVVAAEGQAVPERLSLVYGCW